jgi:tRNA (mo5U34)-methyltransferase
MEATDTQLLERAQRNKWYHTLELQPGVWTEGWFDLRDAVRHYDLPEDMTGMRVLDVGTWDGFWAFEFERRGADEVVAIDLDDERDLDWPRRLRPSTFPEHPRGIGFHLAHEIKQSNVQRVVCSIYNAVPEDLGTFDLVFAGSIITHLRDQMLALERINDLCSDTGKLINAEVVDPWLDRVPVALSRFRGHHDSVQYWRPNVKAWRRMLWTAGFDEVELTRRFKMKASDMEVPHAVFHSRKRAAAS